VEAVHLLGPEIEVRLVLDLELHPGAAIRFDGDRHRLH